MRARAWVCLGVIWGVLAVGAPVAGADREGTAEQLPNLVPLPPFDVVIGAPDDAPRDASSGALRFATAVANRGDFALDLFGQPENPAAQTAKAMQCVLWATERVCERRTEVGRFVWHPAHGHHHFEDFAMYELRKLRKNGQPDLRPAGLVAGGTKISFCLMDIEPDDGTTPGPTNPFGLGYPLYMSCVAGTGFQGISAGWRDVYGNRTSGQQILLEGVPDGSYALTVTTDPEDLLLETTKDDNIAVTGVELSEGGTKVKVICESLPGTTSCIPLPEPQP